ncbi:MAG: DUF4147 domain-containing protein, partial [Asgard group archaeon]|nr:DUF4147 domain-containing protein [Asgard group archaeon]
MKTLTNPRIDQERIAFPTKGTTAKRAYEIVIELMDLAIAAADPKLAVLKALKFEKNSLYLSSGENIPITKETRIFVIGGGKAAASMAIALEEILVDKITDGIINIAETTTKQDFKLKKIQANIAGHPFVNEGSIKGTKAMLSLLDDLTNNDLVICLISGGGSALLELPYPTISLQDLKTTFNVLTKIGATIHELNIIRKHLSQVKGGKLAELIQPAKLISLIISDVVGDDLDTIASGPTAPDKSTWNDVEKIIEKYNIRDKLPDNIKLHLDKGIMGEISDTLKTDNSIFQNVTNYIIASNKLSCDTIANKASQMDLNVKILTTSLTGEARENGKDIAKLILKENDNTILIAGGESTVTIKGKGKGGRNQELALAAAIEIENNREIVLASIGTDGKDGPTDAAGAIVDGNTIKEGWDLGLDPINFLA